MSELNLLRAPSRIMGFAVAAMRQNEAPYMLSFTVNELLAFLAAGETQIRHQSPDLNSLEFETFYPFAYAAVVDALAIQVDEMQEKLAAAASKPTYTPTYRLCVKGYDLNYSSRIAAIKMARSLMGIDLIQAVDYINMLNPTMAVRRGDSIVMTEERKNYAWVVMNHATPEQLKAARQMEDPGFFFTLNKE